jgi:hypothetical protein
MIELRCGGTMHGKLDLEAMVLEVKCRHRRCGARPGVVVLHTFNLSSGDLIRTERYADPSTRKDSDDQQPAAEHFALRAS